MGVLSVIVLVCKVLDIKCLVQDHKETPEQTGSIDKSVLGAYML